MTVSEGGTNQIPPLQLLRSEVSSRRQVELFVAGKHVGTIGMLRARHSECKASSRTYATKGTRRISMTSDLSLNSDSSDMQAHVGAVTQAMRYAMAAYKRGACAEAERACRMVIREKK